MLFSRLRPCLALLCLAGCRPESPQRQVQKAFDTCVEAIEEADPERALEAMGPGFTGPESMTREEAKLYLVALLEREKIGVTVLSSRIEIEDSKASQTVELLLTSRTGSSILPQDSSHRIFHLRWALEDSHWMLQSIQQMGITP